MLRHIESPTNPLVKRIDKLKKRRNREREGVFLLEGQRELERAVACGYSFEEIILCPEFIENYDTFSLNLKEKTNQSTTTKQLYSHMSYRENPDGVLAIAKIKTHALADITLPENAFVLVLENLEKPGNIGALLRTADGVGVDAVIITGQTDLYNPNMVRSSMGSLFYLNIALTDNQSCLDWLKASNIQSYATTPHTKKTYWQGDFKSASAIILGTEHDGLSAFWHEHATEEVVIPMAGLADSLNVASAGALLMYEVLRQRQDQL